DPTANPRVVGHEADAVLPQMQLVSWRFQQKAERRFRTDVENDLMCGAWRRPSDCAGKAAIDRTVQMPTQDPLHLRMAEDHLGKPGSVVETVFVHMLDAGLERRMMHQHERRSLGGRAERLVQPSQPFGA